MPLLLQYHPRMVAAGYLRWVMENEKEKEHALKVPEQLGTYAWFQFVDPEI
jgi:hypothetical protein